MTEEKKLRPGEAKCGVCGKVKYLGGASTTGECDTCRIERETFGESGHEFCPMIKSACHGERCRWWVEQGDGFGECSVQLLGDELNRIRTNGIEQNC